MRGLAGAQPDEVERLPDLPAVLRRAPLAVPYLEAEHADDQPAAGSAALAAAQAGIAAEAWWAADIWAHRALWHLRPERLE
jgi:hypothetical protein